MNKHFRVSGSIFRSWKNWESVPPRSCAEPGFPRALSINRACSLTTEELFAFWRAVGEVSTESRDRPPARHRSKIERLQPQWLSPLSQPRTSARRSADGSLQTAHLPGRNPAGEGRRRVEHSVPLAAWPRSRANSADRHLLCLGALGRSPRHRHSPVAAAIGVHGTSRAFEDH